MTARAITCVQAVVRRIESAGNGIKHFTLEDEDGWELPPARPGAHIDLLLAGGVLRTYSLCSGPQHQTRYEIAVKREAGGRGGSAFLHDRVREGDVIGLSLPRGGLALPTGMRQVFLAGGIGVTPFLSAADELLRRGDRDFILHVLARGEPPLARLLAPLQDQGLAVLHDTRIGRPELDLLLGPARPGVMLSCCGPATMLDAFETATANWPQQQVHVERFVPPVLVPDPEAAPYTLVLARTNRTLDVPAGMPMIEAIASCGIDVPTSCGGGICGACKVGVIEGKPLHHDRILSPAEREHSLLACVAGCAGGRLVLDL
ncbi:MAG: PDR/VanB family oxidoreductase [Janthinobacterium lividum]